MSVTLLLLKVFKESLARDGIDSGFDDVFALGVRSEGASELVGLAPLGRRMDSLSFLLLETIRYLLEPFTSSYQKTCSFLTGFVQS